MSDKPVVFSGIQPTGTIHIGNYYGAVRRWATEQDEHFNIFCLVDMHAITLPQDPAELREKTLETAAVLLAAGIDPSRSALFVQSDVAEHAELAWLMNCVVSMGQLERMTQYKEKSAEQRGGSRAGLFTYPLLMAADILLYRTRYVPVGADQKQHVELTRDLAQRFNTTFGETFVLPEPTIPKVGARIMGLDDPTKKMSKSGTGSGHAVGVLDPPDAIRKAIMSAKTDSGTEIRIDPARPGVSNLLSIYMAATGSGRDGAEARFAGTGYGALKNAIVEALVAELTPLQKRYAELRSDPVELRAVLTRSADAIRPIAHATYEAARLAMGLGLASPSGGASGP
ncbi:MAG TPA: tryptophan--tRNA ligase [Candidatus Elarobacter sp.]|nr:tryptophan--tRNA ligase [Candidatus Elarobacter sp.]